MTLVTEDGSGLANAESYCSVADADARATALGSTWDGTTTEKEQALRRATAFMEQAYRARWKGTRLLRDQALSWPRYGACVDGFDILSTIVPAEVRNACADLAFKAAAGDLNADLTPRVIRKKTGPIEREYDRYGPQSTRYPSIDQALAPFLKGSSMTAMLVRA